MPARGQGPDSGSGASSMTPLSSSPMVIALSPSIRSMARSCPDPLMREISAASSSASTVDLGLCLSMTKVARPAACLSPFLAIKRHSAIPVSAEKEESYEPAPAIVTTVTSWQRLPDGSARLLPLPSTDCAERQHSVTTPLCLALRSARSRKSAASPSRFR